jgi:hypothetical protein
VLTQIQKPLKKEEERRKKKEGGFEMRIPCGKQATDPNSKQATHKKFEGYYFFLR